MSGWSLLSYLPGALRIAERLLRAGENRGRVRLHILLGKGLFVTDERKKRRPTA